MSDRHCTRAGYDSTGRYHVPKWTPPVPKPDAVRIGTVYQDEETGEYVMPADFAGEPELRWKPEACGDQCPECRAAPGTPHNQACGTNLEHGEPLIKDTPYRFVPTHPLEGPPIADCTVFPVRETAAEEETHGRYFPGGAYRDDDAGKLDYEGFLSPLVLQAFGEYMERHRHQSDGRLRDSDNWQAGIPREQYVKSLLRHVHDLWLEHDGFQSRDGIDEALGGVVFNALGFWYELLMERRGLR